MAPKIHLYLMPGGCSFAPHILLHEANLPYTSTALDVRDGFPADHLKVNPKGQVPILILDGETITENIAIITAIAQLAPAQKLLGTTDLEIVRCYEWMSWLAGKLHGQAFGALFRPGRFVNDDNLRPAVLEKARETIEQCYEYIEEKLEGKKWAVGDAFTAVDAYLLVFYRWGDSFGFAVGEKYKNYKGLVEKVVEKESVLRAAEAEGIELLSK